MSWPSEDLSFANEMNKHKNRRKNDVLFVLKVPPPYGGGEIEHKLIYDFLKENYNILLFSRTTHNKAKQGRVIISNVFYGLYMIFRLLKSCLIRRPKVVFLWLPKDVPGFMRTVFLAAIMRLFRIKVIGDLHGMGFSFLQRHTLRLYYRLHINLFNTIRVLSPSIGERIRDSGFRNEIVSIDNAVLAPDFPKTKRVKFQQPIRLLYLGAISESKGFFRVLQLIKDMSRLNVRFSLNVVGEWVDGQFRNESFDYIEENRLSPYIQFHGVKLDKEKWRLLWNSHLLLHFSTWDGQPLTILEAMAAGVPTIATPVGAIPEMIEHNVDGFLIDRVDQTIHIILELLANRLDYEAVSSTARRTFHRRFTVQKYIHEIEKLVTVE